MDFAGQARSAEKPPLVWVTGAAGLIGNYLLQTVAGTTFPVRARAITRRDLNLEDFPKVESLFKKEKPSAIIHAAAISKSPECEKNPQLAIKVNFKLTEFLAGIGAEIPLVFLSTDLVFDGEKGYYLEEDQPNPLSVYAETKVNAERAVLTNPRHTVLRTSLNCGRSLERNRSFNEEMRKAWDTGRCLNLFVDEYRSPIPAEITARTLWQVLGNSLTGIYHIAGRERLSRYEIAQSLTDYLPQFREQIIPGSRKEYKGPSRPRDTSLNCSRIEKSLGIQMPMFKEWLRNHHASVL